MKYWLKNNIQPNITLLEKKECILYVDNNILNGNNLNEVLDLCRNMDENDLIHFKLKLNIDEFVTISNYLFPVVYKIIFNFIEGGVIWGTI